MRIEKLSKGRKKVILVITILVLLIGIIYITNSKAKYHVTSNIQIVKGKVSYSLADLNVLALQVQESENSEKYNPTDEVPIGNYEVNMQNSYCTIPGDNIEHKDIPMEYKDGKVSISITKKGTKCYVFLDFKKTASGKTLEALKLSSQGDVGSITGPSCNGEKGSECYSSGSNKNNMAQNGVYSAEDDFGTSYVFRGTVNNNWVKFGQEGEEDLWWRIIRINGNGTIRMIYSGKGNSPSATGEETRISGIYAFNSNDDDNTYVGFKYGSIGQNGYTNTHQNTNKSAIMIELEKWYEKTTLNTLETKIDVDTGFCNDRELSPEDHGNYLGPTGGYNKVQTAYAAYHRVNVSKGTGWDTTIQRPTLKCGNKTRDLFTGPNARGTTDSEGRKINGNNKLETPVGLITADEVIYAGGFGGQNNDGYWLCTGANYWTMSPIFFSSKGEAYMLTVRGDGYLDSYSVDYVFFGIRPVINLKADTYFTFESEDDKGTISNPYIVQ